MSEFYFHMKLCLSVLFVCAPLVSARTAPITYTFAGIGTGSVGATPFTNTAFTISAFADTTNLIVVPGSASTLDAVYHMPALESEVGVAGIGCGVFIIGTQIFFNGVALGFANDSSDIFDIISSQLSGYDLTTSFPQVSHLSPQPGALPTSQATSSGTLTFTSLSDISVQAVLGNFTAPQIVVSPTNQIVNAGDSLLLSCQSTGTPPFAFQWRQGNVDIPFAVNPTLSRSNVQAGMAGDYSVVVTNLFGAVTSQVATVVVHPTAPVFILQPVSQSASLGSNATFSTAARGSEPIGYQWYLNNQPRPDGTNTVLSLTNLGGADGGQYLVVASNQVGMATGQVAMLSVIVAPLITEQPASQGCPDGATARFSAAALGPGSLTWQWYLGDSQIPGATNSKVSITNVQSVNRGDYWAVVTDAYGSTTSVVATLSFSPLLAWGYSSNNLATVPPGATNIVSLAGGDYHAVISKSDGSVLAWGLNSTGQVNVPFGLTNVARVSAGSTHSLALASNGPVSLWGQITGDGNTVPPSASNLVSLGMGPSAWHALGLRANGTVVDWGYSGFGVTAVPARATNVVDVAAGGNHALALRGDGTVVGWGNNLSGQINIPATATNVVAIAAGLNHSLALRANGTLMTWGDASHGQSLLPRSATNIIAIACGDNHSLAVRSDGAVLAWGDNTYGEATVPVGTSNVVAVAATGFGSMALVGDGPPIITTPLLDRVVLSGSIAPLRVAAVGARPLYYQWLLNGNAVMGATNSVLLLTNVQPDNAGMYSAVVSNALGIATSSEFSLNLIPLVITTQPQSQSVLAGSDVSFTSGAGGQNPIEFQWWLNGKPIDGATNSTLLLTNVQPALAGGYTVVFTNASGALTSSVAVLGIIPLAITTQPQSQSVPMGSTVSFSVTAAIQGPFSYQWLFNGAAIPDGTANPLILSNVQPEQAGSYSVLVSNQWGATNSANATLSVLDLNAWGSNSDGQGVVPVGLTNVLGIASGYYHNLALKSDGSVLAWGNSGFGQTKVNLVHGLTNVIAVGAASFDSIALKANGTVIVWGYNIDGEGNVPPDLTNAVAVAGGESHLLALRSDGTVTAWGKNDYFQTNVPPDLTNAVAVAAGGAHSVALRRDGSVVAWGRNDVGQCTVPVDVTNAIAIGAGYLHTIALKDDLTVVAWGGNDYGQTNVPVGLSNVVAITGGVWHNLALLSDGSVTAWGRDDNGQSNIPQGLKAVAISAGDFHSLALLSTTPPILRALVSAPAPSNALYTLRVPTQSGRVYELEYKRSLDETNWTPLPLVPGSGQVRLLTDPAADGTERFYRIRRW